MSAPTPNPAGIRCRAVRRGLGFGPLAALAVAAALTGCARFDSRPLSPSQTAEAFDQRSLADAGLRAFLETNGISGAWPRPEWDLDALTVAAFYYHPEMDLARARWHAATAGKLTAGQRPNPNLAFTPRLNSSAIGTRVTPWILGAVLDIPVETMGKRKYRVAQAQHLDAMARFDLASAAWAVRSRVRNSLITVQTARESASLLRTHADALGRVARLVEAQQQSGAVSAAEVSTARVAHDRVLLDLKDRQRQEVDARGQLAEAIGVPLHALEDVTIAFGVLTTFPTNLTTAALQRQAVLNRADVLSALAEYAASESALQVQLARQYPDIHLRPGYELDQTKNKWQLGISIDLPILNQNQGPIAEARAKREELAAKFGLVQAKAIGEMERATAVYLAAVGQASTANRVLANLEQSRQAMTRRYEAGDVDKLVVTVAEAECLHGALLRLTACAEAQRSLAAVENAVQVPLLMPVQPALLETDPLTVNKTNQP